MTLVITLKALPFERVMGNYTIHGQRDKMPDRALFLHPAAADSFLTDLIWVVGVSDLLRTAESSLNAVVTGRGAQSPGYSGHNFGFCLDAKVDESMARLHMTRKTDFDRWMEERGWYCHRRDGQRGHEDWHYNFLRAFELLGLTQHGAKLQLSSRSKFTSGDLEQLIQRVYGADLAPTDTECQQALQDMKFYHGAVDGLIGPLSREAISAFQRAWIYAKDKRTGKYVPVVTGKLDQKTRRTIAFVAARKRIVA